MQLTEFYDYVKGFYGTGGIYQFDIPASVLKTACALVQNRKDFPFVGDFIDRERVRDVIEMLGYCEVTK